MSLTAQLEASFASGEWEPTGETLDQIVKRDLSHRSTLPHKSDTGCAVAAPASTGAGLSEFIAFALADRDAALAVMQRGGDGFSDALDSLIESDGVLAMFHKFEMSRIARVAA